MLKYSSQASFHLFQVIYDQFNIDPHSFSAIWYALDTVTVADVKDKDFNSRAG